MNKLTYTDTQPHNIYNAKSSVNSRDLYEFPYKLGVWVMRVSFFRFSLVTFHLNNGLNESKWETFRGEIDQPMVPRECIISRWPWGRPKQK